MSFKIYILLPGSILEYEPSFRTDISSNTLLEKLYFQ